MCSQRTLAFKMWGQYDFFMFMKSPLFTKAAFIC